MFAGCCRAVRGRPRRFGWGQRTAREANVGSVGSNGWSAGANRGAVGTNGWAGAATEVPLGPTALSWRPTECRWAGTEGSRAPTREPGGLGRAWPVGLWSWPLRFLVAPFIGWRRLPQARRGRQGLGLKMLRAGALNLPRTNIPNPSWTGCGRSLLRRGRRRWFGLCFVGVPKFFLRRCRGR